MRRLLFGLLIVLSVAWMPLPVVHAEFSSFNRASAPNPFGERAACSEYECSLHWFGNDYCKGPGESVSTPACTFTCWCGDSGDCLWWSSDCG